MLLGHSVKGRSILEPLDLRLIVGVGQFNLEGLTILGVNAHSHGLTHSKLSGEKVNLVEWADLVVVGWVGKCQGKHTLLLQVGLMNTSERSGDDSKATKMSGFKSGMLSGGSFTVIPVTNNNPWDTLLLVITSSSWDGTVFTSSEVLYLVCLSVIRVDGTDKHVVGDVVKMSTVLQPRTGHRDVISGGLALALNQNRHIQFILSIPGLERLENLKTVGGRGDGNANR